MSADIESYLVIAQTWKQGLKVCSQRLLSSQEFLSDCSRPELCKVYLFFSVYLLSSALPWWASIYCSQGERLDGFMSFWMEVDNQFMTRLSLAAPIPHIGQQHF